jgi:Heavy-metal resistance
MFGFIIGTASLIALFMLLRRRHGYWYSHGYGGGWGGYGRWRHAGPGGQARRSWMLRWLFRHLDTTAGQEKVINSAGEDLEGRLREMKSELDQLRKEIARSLRMPQFDGSAMRESFAKQRAHLDTLEESVIGHLAKLHEALDERQRNVFAELVQDGPRRSMRGYGCRYGYGRYHDPDDDGRGAWKTA